MEIKILGPGCAKCHALEKAVGEVVREMGIEAKVDHVKDIKEIMSYGIMLTPGLVINGKVKSSGKVVNKNNIKKFINQEK